MERFDPPGECPVCGDYVPAGASACDGCGSCPDTGWSEEVLYDGIDLPGDDVPTAQPEPGSGTIKILGALILLGLIVYVFVFR